MTLKSIKQSYQLIKKYLTEKKELLNVIQELSDKNKLVTEINPNTGDVTGYCPYMLDKGIKLSSKDCINCKFYCGHKYKFITTLTNNVYISCLVTCYYSYNPVYKFIFKYILKPYKKFTNKLNTYKIIYLKDL